MYAELREAVEEHLEESKRVIGLRSMGNIVREAHTDKLIVMLCSAAGRSLVTCLRYVGELAGGRGLCAVREANTSWLL